MKPIKVSFTKLGRKNKYLGIQDNEKAIFYPAVYFRESKFATQDEFDALLEAIEKSLG